MGSENVSPRLNFTIAICPDATSSKGAEGSSGKLQYRVNKTLSLNVFDRTNMDSASLRSPSGGCSITVPLNKAMLSSSALPP